MKVLICFLQLLLCLYCANKLLLGLQALLKHLR